MIKLILGPPGTGKTTKLLNLVDEYLKKGVRPDKIGFISFTKKAVNEARGRAADRFGIPLDDYTYFRTIHSLSFRQLSISRSEVMQRSNYKDLGDILGMKITGIHRQDQMIYEMSKGDQMVFMESLSRLKCETLEDTWQNADSDISIHELVYFRKALEQYKKANILYDFTDMLVRYLDEGHKPELDVLFVDEAQDLCTLQWKIVESLVKSSKDSYIAGDDDQAIFRWSGADVDYFMALSKSHETDILHQSYRLSKNVYNFSIGLVKQILKRTDKRFSPTEETGSVEHVAGIDGIDMDKGDWLILVRNGYLINDIVEDLRLRGYPYETNYYAVQNDEAIKAILIWENLRKGVSMLVNDILLMMQYISVKTLGDKKLDFMAKEEHMNMRELEFHKVLRKETVTEIWHKVLDKIPAEDREYYISILRRKEKLTKKARIKVSTIHGAKGGEAGNVVLFTDMSLKTYNNMQENFDDELRVFYVGATRAKSKLFIVEPQTTNCFTI